MADKLWELESLVKDAVSLLEQAETMCGNFLVDAHTGEPLPWKEMERTANMLGHAREWLKQALTPIEPAIREEREQMDHDADMADGRSY